MRRIISTASIVLLAMQLFLSTAYAVGPSTTESRIDYEDGSYAIITTVTPGAVRAAVADEKTYTYYNPSGKKCFAYTLYATFSYDGRTSRALSCDYDIGLSPDGWDIDSHDEWTSGNTAYGEAVFIGPGGTEREVSLSLTCDKDGNVK